MDKKRVFSLLLVFCLFFFLAPFTCRAETEIVTQKEMTLDLTLGTRKGLYTGPLVDGLPHGTGTFESQNDEGVAWRYEGSFVNGQFQGNGTLAFVNGTKREGVFKNSLLNGYGKQYYDNGQLYYEGEWKNDEIHGYGKYYNRDGGLVFDGQFKNGKADNGTYYQDNVSYHVENGQYQTIQNESSATDVGGMIFLIFIIILLLALAVACFIAAKVLFKRGFSLLHSAGARTAPQSRPATRSARCQYCGENSKIPVGQALRCQNCGAPLKLDDEL